jgi:hypothetical protein
MSHHNGHVSLSGAGDPLNHYVASERWGSGQFLSRLGRFCGVTVGRDAGFIHKTNDGRS